MTKRISRLLSMLLAAVMVLSMAMTGLAAEIEPMSSTTDETFSITVTGAADGETYTAYKIFDVTYDNSKESYSYTIDFSSAWYETVAEATDVFTLTQVNGGTTYIVTVNEGVEDDAIIAVFTEAGVPEGAEAAASATASGGQAYLDVTASGAGYYYVTTTLGSLVIIDTTNPTQTIEEKNGQPTISKYVHENTDSENTWGHEDDAYNMGAILFELEIENINGAVNLIVHDSMDEELGIINPEDFHMNSVVLYTSEGAEGIKLVEGTDYTVTVGDCSKKGVEGVIENCAFEINFTGYDFSSVTSTGYIEITYVLYLNTEGDAYENDYEEFDNWAQVTYGTTSESTPVEARTFSFGFEVYKYTGSNEALEGVEFELKSTTNDEGKIISDKTAYFLEENIDDKTIYLFEGWLDNEDDPNSTYTKTLVTGSDGMIYIEGLDTGTYNLEETQALDGYNALTGPVTVTIEATYDEDTGAMLTHTVTYTYDDDEDTGVVNIENNAGTLLPGTGGMGTTLFYIVGVVLILGAAVLFVTKKRLDKEQ